MFDALTLTSLLVVATAMALAQCLDVLATLARGSLGQSKSAENFALSGWIFYLSRILIMLVVLGLSLLMESGLSRMPVPLVLACSFVLAWCAMVMVVRSRGFAMLLYRLIYPVVVLSFPSYSPQHYWTRLRFRLDNRLAAVSAVSMLALLAGATLPFILAELIPKYRMTAVYVGQFTNFAATIIVLSYQDPAFNRRLDAGDNEDALAHVVSGKLVGLGVFAAALLLMAVRKQVFA